MGDVFVHEAPYRTAAELFDTAREEPLPPHVEIVDGARVLRTCTPPGWWSRLTCFREGDIWECPVCRTQFRCVGGGALVSFWTKTYDNPFAELLRSVNRIANKQRQASPVQGEGEKP
jgi:hypothetical protein